MHLGFIPLTTQKLSTQVEEVWNLSLIGWVQLKSIFRRIAMCMLRYQGTQSIDNMIKGPRCIN